MQLLITHSIFIIAALKKIDSICRYTIQYESNFQYVN